MAKNIWIDGYEANVLQRLGSSQVAFELLKNIALLDKENNYKVLLPNKPLDDLPKETQNFKYEILKPKQLWTKIALPLKLLRSKTQPDIFFSPTHYLPILSKVKKVATIFDLSFLRFPEFFQKKDLWQLTSGTRYSAKHADQIITISNSTKKDIMHFYGLKQEKISVCYPGFNEKLFYPISDKPKIDLIKEKYKIDQNYIIFIGTVQPRKNLIRLIEAFRKIENLKLVVVGKIRGEGRKAWMFEEILKKPNELNIEDKIIFTDFVPDEELPYLINGAVAYILPSLWEGFGIPVVEAMACGVPVIVANVSSLPEVVGDAGLQVDPNSIDQIEQAIRLVHTDKKLRMSLSKKSLIQSQKYSWKKMTKEVIKILENI